MGRKLRIAWREDAATLYQQYKKEKDPQNRTRLQALWLVRTGRTVKAAAEVIGVGYRTVQRWIDWYRQGGVREVLSRRHGGHSGPPRRLSPKQEAELKAKSEAGEIRSIQDGVIWAETACGVVYTYWGMRWVFARLDLRPKVPRPRSPKASEAEQMAWKKGGLPRS